MQRPDRVSTTGTGDSGASVSVSKLDAIAIPDTITSAYPIGVTISKVDAVADAHPATNGVTVTHTFRDANTHP